MLRFNVAKIDELRRANGAPTNAEFARSIGISPTTLWRVTDGGESPSPSVISRFKAAFPLLSFDDLLCIVDRP